MQTISLGFSESVRLALRSVDQRHLDVSSFLEFADQATGKIGQPHPPSIFLAQRSECGARFVYFVDNHCARIVPVALQAPAIVAFRDACTITVPEALDFASLSRGENVK